MFSAKVLSGCFVFSVVHYFRNNPQRAVVVGYCSESRYRAGSLCRLSRWQPGAGSHWKEERFILIPNSKDCSPFSACIKPFRKTRRHGGERTVGKVPGGGQVAAKMWGWDSDTQSQSTPHVNSIPFAIYIKLNKYFKKKRKGKGKTLDERILKPSCQGVCRLIFCRLDTKWIIWEEGTSPSDWLINKSVGYFLDEWLMWRPWPTMRGATPGQVVLDYVSKKAEPVQAI